MKLRDMETRDTAQTYDENLFTRVHALVKDSILDEEERRIRLTFSSEDPYERGYWDKWNEILGHKADEIDLSRLSDGAPLLKNHWDGIGVVEKAWVEGTRGFAEVRLSKREAVSDLWSDIKDGIVRNVSVGYRSKERTLVKENDGAPNDYRVTSWLPMEISILSDVPPADATVGIGRAAYSRADETFFSKHTQPEYANTLPPADASRAVDSLPKTQEEMDAAINEAVASKLREDSNLNEETQMDEDDNVIELQKKEIEEKAAREALEQDRQRREAIANVFALYPGKFQEERQTFADGKRSDDSLNTEADAKDFILRALAEENKDVEPLGQDVRVGEDGDDKFQKAAEHALLSRAGIEKQEADNEYNGMTLLRLAEHCLSRRGIQAYKFGQNEIIQRAFTMMRDGAGTHTPGDFPLLLGNVANKALLKGYTETPETFQAWTSVGTLTDFKTADRVGLSEMEGLDEIEDTEEPKYGSATEFREQITLKQYAKRFRLSRKTIINDDLGAFTAVPRKMGRAAMRTVGDTVYAVLTANANMSDGKALFHADHSNLETGAGSAISTANIDKMSQKMAKQKDYSDKATLNIMPGFFLCPVALRSEAKILFASEKDPKATNANSARPNPIRNMISEDRIIADARLDVDSATAYYMLADPAAYDVIEVAYLNGVALPRLMQQSIWLTEGVTFEAAHDFGVKSLDWRTVQKANGAA